MEVKHTIILENEREVVRECIAGNRAMQNKLYARFSSQMMVICLRYSKSRHDAEEILQEGFIKVFTCLHQYRFKSSLEAWIRKIMINCALEKLRTKNILYSVVHPEDVADDFADNSFIVENIHAKELIQLMQTLPTVCRIVFNLYVFEGLKHKEIAKLLNISEGTSKSNLHDARMRLQSRLMAKINYINISAGA